LSFVYGLIDVHMNISPANQYENYCIKNADNVSAVKT